MRLALILAPLLALAVTGCESPRLADGPSPAFEVRDLKSQSTLSKKSLAGHPIVIDFWETWCGPCREMMPEVQRLYDDYDKKGVRVIGVSDEDSETVSKFVRDRSLTYTFALDPAQVAAGKFGVDSFPTMILIDPQGNIVYRESPPDMDEVRKILDRMVQS